jgi:uncharacterized protein (DUF924 family)
LKILQYWFSGSLEEQFQRWFASGDSQRELDNTISKEYGELLHKAEQGELDPEGWSNSPSAFAAKIILVDQFSRHIYRGNQEKIKVRVNLLSGLGLIAKENDKMSLAWSKELVSRGWSKYLPVNQHVFSLMPLRHSNEEENLNIVVKQIEEREAAEHNNMQYANFFYS